MERLHLRAFRASALGILTMALLLFLPAGTLEYWQAWVFMAVFVSASAVVTVYVAIHDPELLERRMTAGPTAEKEKSQKIIMFFAMAGFVALVVVPALDRRLGWSSVPVAVSLFGNVLVALGFLLVFFVMKENTYSASTIQVVEGQKVVSTGPYALVRHPMYAGSLPLVIGTPLALGSWWGLLTVFPFIAVLAWRLLDEEEFLKKNLRATPNTPGKCVIVSCRTYGSRGSEAR